MNLPLLTRAVQEALGVSVDGNAGPQTWAAIYEKVTGKVWSDPIQLTKRDIHDPEPAVAAADRVDERSEKNILTLLPEVRPYARAMIHEALAQGITAVITSGSRTYAEQDALYAQGRNGNPGAIVT